MTSASPSAQRVTFNTGSQEQVGMRDSSHSHSGTPQPGAAAGHVEGGACNCCPYGYHIDLDFLNFCRDMESGSTLRNLKRIQRAKRKLRKSMEIMLDEDGSAPGAPGEAGDPQQRLMHMVNYERSASHKLLSQIDSQMGRGGGRGLDASADSDDSVPPTPVTPPVGLGKGYAGRTDSMTSLSSMGSSVSAAESHPAMQRALMLQQQLMQQSAATHSLQASGQPSAVTSPLVLTPPQLSPVESPQLSPQSMQMQMFAAQYQQEAVEEELISPQAAAQAHAPAPPQLDFHSASPSLHGSTQQLSSLPASLHGSQAQLSAQYQQNASLHGSQRFHFAHQSLEQLNQQTTTQTTHRTHTEIIENPVVEMATAEVKQVKVTTPCVESATAEMKPRPLGQQYTASSTAQLAEPPPDPTPDPQTLAAVREAMALSLARMRELEEQVKAIPILQVRISVLKEEKRLLNLQLKAAQAKPVTRDVASGPDKAWSPPPVAPKPPKMDTRAVGDDTVAEPAQPQMPSGFFIQQHESHTRELETKIIERERIKEVPTTNVIHQSEREFLSSEKAAPHFTINAIQRGSPKPLTRSVGVGEGDVFDTKLSVHEKELTTVFIGQNEKIAKRNVGIECRAPTRDVGVSFVCEEEKPEMRTVGVNVNYDMSNVHSTLDFKGEKELRLALQGVLKKNLKSTGTSCDMRAETCDSTTVTEKEEGITVGCGDEDMTIDVVIRKPVVTKSVSIQEQPESSGKSVSTNPDWVIDTATNTQPVDTFNAGIMTEQTQVMHSSSNTEAARQIDEADQTDKNMFVSLDIMKSTAVNTQGPSTTSTSMETEVTQVHSVEVNTTEPTSDVFYRPPPTACASSNTEAVDLRSHGSNTDAAQTKNADSNTDVAVTKNVDSMTEAVELKHFNGNTDVNEVRNSGMSTDSIYVNQASVNTSEPFYERPEQQTCGSNTEPAAVDSTGSNTDLPSVETIGSNTDKPNIESIGSNTDKPNVGTKSSNTEAPDQGTKCVNTEMPSVESTAMNTDKSNQESTACNTEIKELRFSGTNTETAVTRCSGIVTDSINVSSSSVNTFEPFYEKPEQSTIFTNTEKMAQETTGINTDIPSIETTASNTEKLSQHTISINTEAPSTESFGMNTETLEQHTTSSNTEIYEIASTSCNTDILNLENTGINTDKLDQSTTSSNTEIHEFTTTSCNTEIATESVAIETEKLAQHTTSCNTDVHELKNTFSNTETPSIESTGISTEITEVINVSMNTQATEVIDVSMNTQREMEEEFYASKAPKVEAPPPKPETNESGTNTQHMEEIFEEFMAARAPKIEEAPPRPETTDTGVGDDYAEEPYMFCETVEVNYPIRKIVETEDLSATQRSSLNMEVTEQQELQLQDQTHLSSYEINFKQGADQTDGWRLSTDVVETVSEDTKYTTSCDVDFPMEAKFSTYEVTFPITTEQRTEMTENTEFMSVLTSTEQINTQVGSPTKSEDGLQFIEEQFIIKNGEKILVSKEITSPLPQHGKEVYEFHDIAGERQFESESWSSTSRSVSSSFSTSYGASSTTSSTIGFDGSESVKVSNPYKTVENLAMLSTSPEGGEASTILTESSTRSMTRSSRTNSDGNLYDQKRFSLPASLQNLETIYDLRRAGSVEDFMPDDIRKYMSIDPSTSKDSGFGEDLLQRFTAQSQQASSDKARSGIKPIRVSKRVTTKRTTRSGTGERVVVQETKTVEGPDGHSETTYLETENGKLTREGSMVRDEMSADERENSKYSSLDRNTGKLRSILKKKKEGEAGAKKGLRFDESVIGGTGSSSEEERDMDEYEDEERVSDSGDESEVSYEEGSYDGRGGGVTYRCSDDETVAAGLPGAQIYDQNIRQTYELSSEVREACQVVSTYLTDSTQVQTKELNAATTTVSAEWFKVSSHKLSSPHQVEDFLSSVNEISRRLLEHIVNMADANGNTAIHYCISHGNIEIANLLLESELCDINRANKAGYTAIMLAGLATLTDPQHTSVVARLFQAGDVNARAQTTQQTALMLAASHGRVEAVGLLCQAGADLNLQDCDGSTALMCACEHGHLDVATLLLQQPNLDASLKDNEGSSALTIAMEAGHKDLGVVLYKHLNFSSSRLAPGVYRSLLKLNVKLIFRVSSLFTYVRPSVRSIQPAKASESQL